MNIKKIVLALAAPLLMNAQTAMTPEMLWNLNRLSVAAVSPDLLRGFNDADDDRARQRGFMECRRPQCAQG